MWLWLLGAALANEPAHAAWETGSNHIPVLGAMELDFSPVDLLHPLHVADPYRPDMRFVATQSFGEPIDGAGDLRWGTRIGGRYGFFRFHPTDDPDVGAQIDIAIGFLAQFDLENQLDNIGWDGVYSFQLSWALANGLAGRAGTSHDSSHIGDEFGGDEYRINYTREEYILSLSWGPGERWWVYTEGGYAYYMGCPTLQLPWRAQYGAVLESRQRLLGNRVGVYVATDASHFEEDEWALNYTVQSGLLYPVPELGRAYRLGLEYYDGRAPIGEFFTIRERYLSAGVWFDL